MIDILFAITNTHVTTLANPVPRSRLPRYEPGWGEEATFLDDDDYQALLDILAKVHRLWGIEVFAYLFNEKSLRCLSSYAERKSVSGHASCGWDSYPTIQPAPSPDGSLFAAVTRQLSSGRTIAGAAIGITFSLGQCRIGLIRQRLSEPIAERKACHEFVRSGRGLARV